MTSKTDKTEFEVARLRVRPQFLYVRHGKTERRKALLVQARRRKGASPGAHAGAGFTATKKIGNAVIRNRVRRRFKEAVRETAPGLARPDCDYVLIARPAAVNQQYAQLCLELREAFQRVNSRLSGRQAKRNRRPGR